MVQCRSKRAFESGYIAIVGVTLRFMIATISVTSPPIPSIAFRRKEGINHITPTSAFLTRIPELDVHSVSLGIQDLFLHNYFPLCPAALRNQLRDFPVVSARTNYNRIVVGIILIGLGH
jgi:hypothetical protein